MGLPDLIRSLIAGPVTAIAGPFRADVYHTPIIDQDLHGPVYAIKPIKRKALVEYVSQNVASEDGSMKLSTSHFTFFEQITIHEGDRLTVNNVTTNVVKVGGLLDETGVPYLPEAWTG